jgi:hypothetical protein
MQGCSSPVSIVLPAGSSQAAQNTAAQQMFQQIGAQQAQCDAIKSLPPGSKLPVPISLTAITQYACVNTPFSATIFASSTPSGAPFTMIVAPQPAWMVTAQGATSLFMDGTPIAIGPVNFTVTATGTNATGSKSYTLNIVGIATASPLPNGAIGGAYSETLDASSIPGVLVWSVVSGALPDGLTLDPVTGEIAGTPTTDIIAAFTISASNGTVTCSKDFDLEITSLSACDAIFNALVWDAPFQTDTNGGISAVGTLTGGTFSGTASQPGHVSPPLSAQGFMQLSATVNYTGGPLVCCFSGSFIGTATTPGSDPFNGQSDTHVEIRISQDTAGGDIFLISQFGTGVQIDWTSLPFNIVDSPGGSVITVTVNYYAEGYETPLESYPASSISLFQGIIGDC